MKISSRHLAEDGDKVENAPIRKKRNLKDRFAFVTGGIDDVMSDNTMISVYPLGQNYFCFYESPFLQQVRSQVHGPW